MQFDNPFSEEPISLPGTTAEEAFERLCQRGDDMHALGETFDFYAAWNGPTVEEPAVHTDGPPEDCPVCGPLLRGEA